MKVLLSGASGFIGRHIGVALSDAGHEVVAVSRSTGLDFNKLCNPADWQPHLQGIEVVINAVGIIAERSDQSFATLHYQAPSALFSACVDAGVKRVIQISALGADEHAFTPYQLTKKAADDVLRSFPLAWFVLRPSLVYGPGGKSAAMFRRLAGLPVIPLVAHGKQWIQPVHIDDPMATVLMCLRAEQTQRTIDVVGPKEITFVDWLQRLRLQSGKATAMVVSVPFRLALSVSPLLQYLIPLLTPDNLRMLQQGNTADVQPLVDFMGGCHVMYLSLKYVHLISMVLLFGTGLGSAWYKWMADNSGDVRHIAVTNRHVVLADWLFTTPTILIQPITGIWMALILQLPFTTPWIAVSLGLYVVAGACWLPVVWLQIQMRNLAGIAVENNLSLPEQYWHYARWWFRLGVPSFTAMVSIVLLMVFKFS